MEHYFHSKSLVSYYKLLENCTNNDRVMIFFLV